MQTYQDKSMRKTSAPTDAAVQSVTPEQEPRQRAVAASAPLLLQELRIAHRIIVNALAVMDRDQLAAWIKRNQAQGIDGSGNGTRTLERLDIIARAEAWS